MKKIDESYLKKKINKLNKKIHRAEEQGDEKKSWWRKMKLKKLKDKFNHLPNVKYAESVEKAIKSIKLNRGDLLIITGSLYLCSEVLKLN